jgi:hypothetical protein
MVWLPKPAGRPPRHPMSSVDGNERILEKFFPKFWEHTLKIPRSHSVYRLPPPVVFNRKRDHTILVPVE